MIGNTYRQTFSKEGNLKEEVDASRAATEIAAIYLATTAGLTSGDFR
jgi:hypothetical protein